MGRLLREEGQLVGEEESDAAVALANGLNAGPGDFAGGDQRVEAGRSVVGDARGQDGRLEERCGERRALQAFNGVEQGVEMRVPAVPRRKQALPVGEEAGQRVLFDGLDFAAKLGQGLAADLAEDFRVAPLAMRAARDGSRLRGRGRRAASRRRALLDDGGVERQTDRRLRAG